MTKYIKIGFLFFPWLGMAVLGFLYFAAHVDLAISQHYSSQSYKALKTHQEHLTSFMKARRDYENDIGAFQDLGLILPEQYDGKYEPWMRTQMGLIKFDTDGFIVAICSPSSGLHSPECPPQL